MEDYDYCPSCNGSGEGCADGTTCYQCRGIGVVPKEEDDE